MQGGNAASGRFMQQSQLEQFIKEFGASKAAIIRRLLTQATPEDFPKS